MSPRDTCSIVLDFLPGLSLQARRLHSVIILTVSLEDRETSFSFEYTPLVKVVLVSLLTMVSYKHLGKLER